jgi:arsenite methyltransferase
LSAPCGRDPGDEPSACSDRPYESPAMLDVTGPTIRPGGLSLTERALNVCAFRPGDRVLDVGCGMGATVKFLRKRYHLDAVGIDRSEALIAKGVARGPALPLLIGDALELPFADGQMDGLIMECALSATGAVGRALAQAHRVLRAEGCLILTDMYLRESGIGSIDTTPAPHPLDAGTCCCLGGATTRARLEKELCDAGFQLSLWEDHTALLKRLAAEIVWKHGSLTEFWRKVRGSSGDTGHKEEAEANAQRRRLGYYLAIATRD